MTDDKTTPSNFIKTIIDRDLRDGKHTTVRTRFPPEPNGYLHIGHAKSICLNFGLAKEYGGTCNLRFDDTNPEKEEQEYVDSIRRDVQWLGFDWDDREFYASDYFQYMYECALKLIRDGKAYVCSLSPDEMREYRGTLTEAGRESPDRNRPVPENLDLFERMRRGEFPDGAYTLRAKIDMASPNIIMRDPAMYRIKRSHHHRTGDDWCIYPMYDYAHCLSDSVEGITHSLCTLEFEIHRPLYDWFLDQLEVECHPQQIEFARLNISYTVLSKRKLLQLVRDQHVSGWDDPRMPTIAGIRRRGVTAESLRDFCERIGVAKADSIVDLELLNSCLREDLNKRAERRMAVLNPLKVVIENYPEDQTEEFDAPNNPEDPGSGSRKIPFCRELYIERDDFLEDPPKKFFRLAPGREVRLMHAYYITCNEVVKDAAGDVVELRCSYDPDSRGGATPDNRKVKGTLHWVSARHGRKAEVRLYDNLFLKSDPEDVEAGKDFLDCINPESLVVLGECYVEPAAAVAGPETRFQFLRQGYFCTDIREHTPERPVFNRTIGLRDSWSKIRNL